jgi:hypothetical protein
MWRRKWHRKRQNMRVHPINRKTRIRNIEPLIHDEEKFNGFFRMNIEQFYSLSQLVAEEIRKKNNYRRAITPEERLAIFLRYVV